MHFFLSKYFFLGIRVSCRWLSRKNYQFSCLQKALPPMHVYQKRKLAFQVERSNRSGARRACFGSFLGTRALNSSCFRLGCCRRSCNHGLQFSYHASWAPSSFFFRWCPSSSLLLSSLLVFLWFVKSDKQRKEGKTVRIEALLLR